MAGPFGTAPLYLARCGDVLHGSWHLPDLRPFIIPMNYYSTGPWPDGAMIETCGSAGEGRTFPVIE